MSRPAGGVHKKIVEDGYDHVAEQYLATKDVDDPVTLSALKGLSNELSGGADVLDLGCGAAIPVTRWLAQRFVVTGVDVSSRQLELAQRNVPSATLIKADMADLHFAPAIFDAIVAFHSIIHVPRNEHPVLFRRIHRWLKPDGLFLATLSVSAWEGEETNWEGWGAPMRWSHYDGNTNVRLLGDAGFVVESVEPRTTAGTHGNEEWLWITARKPCKETKE